MTVTFSGTAGTAIPKYIACWWDSTLRPGQTIVPITAKGAAVPFGVATGGYMPGADAEVMAEGHLADGAWNWQPLTRLYVANDGTLTQDSALAITWTQPVGVALSYTEIYVRFPFSFTSGGGGGTTITTGTAVVDFGTGGNSAQVDVVGQAGIVAGSAVRAALEYSTSADHNAEEHALVPMRLACGSIVAGTGFTVYARCEWTLSGKWTVSWEWW